MSSHKKHYQCYCTSDIIGLNVNELGKYSKKELRNIIIKNWKTRMLIIHPDKTKYPKAKEYAQFLNMAKELYLYLYREDYSQTTVDEELTEQVHNCYIAREAIKIIRTELDNRKRNNADPPTVYDIGDDTNESDESNDQSEKNEHSSTPPTCDRAQPSRSNTETNSTTTNDHGDTTIPNSTPNSPQTGNHDETSTPNKDSNSSNSQKSNRKRNSRSSTLDHSYIEKSEITIEDVQYRRSQIKVKTLIKNLHIHQWLDIEYIIANRKTELQKFLIDLKQNHKRKYSCLLVSYANITGNDPETLAVLTDDIS